MKGTSHDQSLRSYFSISIIIIFAYTTTRTLDHTIYDALPNGFRY